jgi:hypothetical protein
MHSVRQRMAISYDRLSTEQSRNFPRNAEYQTASARSLFPAGLASTAVRLHLEAVATLIFGVTAEIGGHFGGHHDKSPSKMPFGSMLNVVLAGPFLAPTPEAVRSP